MSTTAWLRNSFTRVLQPNRRNTLLVSPIVYHRHIYLKPTVISRPIRNFYTSSFVPPSSLVFSSHHSFPSSYFEQRRNFGRKGRKGRKGNKKKGQTRGNEKQQRGKRGERQQQEETRGPGTTSYDIKEVITDMQSRMDEVSSNLKSVFKDLQVGRANPDQLDKISLQQDGYDVPLQSIARVATRGAQTLLVNVYDPRMVSPVEKAIRKHMEDSFKDADGSAPNPFIEGGQTVVVPFPKSTKEYRTVLAKLAKQKTEHAKESIRRIRKSQMDNLKKEKKEYEQRCCI